MKIAASRIGFPTVIASAAFAVFASALLTTAGSAVAADKEKCAVAGDYAGDYQFHSTDPQFGNQGGTLHLVISDEGKVTGSAHNTSLDTVAEISGAVDEDGEMKVAIEFPNQTYTAKGTVVKTKKGNLKGNLTQYAGRDNALGAIEFDLPSQRVKSVLKKIGGN